MSTSPSTGCHWPGVPADAAGVALYLGTSSDATAAGDLSVTPAGTADPNVRVVDYQRGQQAHNLYFGAMSASGQLTLFNHGPDPVDVRAAVQGYLVSPSASEAGDTYTSVTQARIVDTRTGAGGVAAEPIPANGSITFSAAGTAGIPSSGVSAVVESVAAINPTATGNLTTYPAGTTDPNNVVVNFTGSDVQDNDLSPLVSSVSPTGEETITNHSTGTVDVVVTAKGYYTSPTAPDPPPQTDAGIDSNGTITVNWQPPDTDGGAAITGYQVTIYNSDGTVNQTATSGPGTTTDSITGLAATSFYSWSVSAVNAVGSSSSPTAQVGDTPPAAAASLGVTVDSSGTIHFANTLTVGQDLANAQTTTMSGTPDGDGGCNFDFSSSESAAVSSSSYTEETAINPATCQETLVSGTLTSAGAAAFASDDTPDATPDTTLEVTPDTTSTPASTTIQDTTVDTTPTNVTGATPDTRSESGSAATPDGSTAAGTWAAFDKISFVDPAFLTITSLTNYLTWSGNGGPASETHHPRQHQRRVLQLPLRQLSAGPFGFSWGGCIGCNSVTSRDSRTFRNTDFEQVLIAMGSLVMPIIGAAAVEMACGFTTAPAVFQLTPATTEFPNGFFGVGWTSHVSGGCSAPLSGPFPFDQRRRAQLVAAYPRLLNRVPATSRGQASGSGHPACAGPPAASPFNYRRTQEETMRNPTNHSRWMRLATHSAALTALTAATAACGSASGVASPVGATVPAPPGAVAVTYITDLATHRLAAATELVLPAGRSEFRVYADIIATRRPGSVRGLTAGSVSITGSTAVVNLTGTICLPSSGSSSSAGTPDCLTQTGPHASNPFFQVTLTKAADGDWYVGSPPVAHGGHIPSATASAPAGYSSATASAPAGYSSATASAPAGYSSATASPVGGSSATASPAG